LLNKDRFLKLFDQGVDLFIITKHEDVLDDKLDNLIFNLPLTLQEKIEYKNFREINLTNRGGALPKLGVNDKMKFFPCKIPLQLIVITKDGNVLPCFEDYFQKNIMGNINNNSLKEIWNNQKFVEFRKNLAIGLRYKYHACKDCNRIEVL
jgi:radical SAM protein with 4Fe4S-binding SPASM domain